MARLDASGTDRLRQRILNLRGAEMAHRLDDDDQHVVSVGLFDQLHETRFTHHGFEQQADIHIEPED